MGLVFMIGLECKRHCLKAFRWFKRVALHGLEDEMNMNFLVATKQTRIPVKLLGVI